MELRIGTTRSMDSTRNGAWTLAVLRGGLKALYERLRLIYVNDLPHFALHNKWWSAEGHGRERARPREACKREREREAEEVAKPERRSSNSSSSS